MVVLGESKRGMSEVVWIIIILVIGLVVAAIFLIIIPREASKTGKLNSCMVFSFGEQNRGYCVAKEIDCSGTVNVIATGCPKDMPVCCIGEAPGETTTGTEGGTAAAKKGTVQLSMKAKLDSQVYLIPGDNFDTFPIKGSKAGTADGKTRKGTSLEMKAVGTQDIKSCSIDMIIGGNTNINKVDCTPDKGTVIKYKFLNLGDYEIKITGSDVKDGTPIAQVSYHIRVE